MHQRMRIYFVGFQWSPANQQEIEYGVPPNLRWAASMEPANSAGKHDLKQEVMPGA